jgi:hypothetical protein
MAGRIWARDGAAPTSRVIKAPTVPIRILVPARIFRMTVSDCVFSLYSEMGNATYDSEHIAPLRRV